MEGSLGRTYFPFVVFLLVSSRWQSKPANSIVLGPLGVRGSLYRSRTHEVLQLLRSLPGRSMGDLPSAGQHCSLRFLGLVIRENLQW